MNTTAHTRHILLVEDHSDTGSVFKKQLEQAGYRVVLVTDGAAALMELINGNFDLVVADIGLPDMDGWDLFEQARVLVPGIAGIATSGYGMNSDVQRSEACGFFKQLVKPFPMSVMLHAIEDVLTRPLSAVNATLP